MMPFAHVSKMRIDRDGTFSVILMDGQNVTSAFGKEAFERTSLISSSTYLPQESRLSLQTTRGDEIFIDLPRPEDPSPLNERITVYLDQNHWSTLTNVLYDPGRVADDEERDAAKRLISLVSAKKIVLPMSAAHISETCKQADFDQRYKRALTITQLSAGWQLRDPLDLRRFELRQALAHRYRGRRLVSPVAVTLDPDALYSARDRQPSDIDDSFPPQVQWIMHVIISAGANVDTMLDAEHVPLDPSAEWVAQFQQFAEFIHDNPSTKEVKRQRTCAKFISDLGKELPEESVRAEITPDEMGDWMLNHVDNDLRKMPSLGIFREVLHEKLSDGRLRWEDNDLTDMVYLAAATGYCDYVVGERAHISHITNGIRRLGRGGRVFRNLRSFVESL